MTDKACESLTSFEQSWFEKLPTGGSIAADLLGAQVAVPPVNSAGFAKGVSEWPVCFFQSMHAFAVTECSHTCEAFRQGCCTCA